MRAGMSYFAVETTASRSRPRASPCSSASAMSRLSVSSRHALCRLQDDLAGFCQEQGLAKPLDQLVANVFLKLADLRECRGLRKCRVSAARV